MAFVGPVADLPSKSHSGNVVEVVRAEASPPVLAVNGVDNISAAINELLAHAKMREQIRQSERANGVRVGATMAVCHEHLALIREMLALIESSNAWSSTDTRARVAFLHDESLWMKNAMDTSANGGPGRSNSLCRFDRHRQGELSDDQLKSMFGALHHQRMWLLVDAIWELWRHDSAPGIYSRFPIGNVCRALKGGEADPRAGAWILDPYFTPEPFFHAEAGILATVMNRFMSPGQKESAIEGALTYTRESSIIGDEQRTVTLYGESLRRMNVIRDLIGLKPMAGEPDEFEQPPVAKRQKDSAESSQSESDQKESTDS